MTPTGPCPHCGLTVRIRRDGTAYRHLSRTDLGGWCVGSNRAPRSSS